MQERFYVFECEGPYGWQIAECITGPYYDETSWFEKSGYVTEADATSAISEFFANSPGYVGSGPFFVMKGYLR